MAHESFHRTRRVACARQGAVLFRVGAIIGAVAFAPSVLSAQSYFTPLVTPPASAGTCMPVRPVHPTRGDTAVMSVRRLLMKSAPPGGTREINVYAQRGRPVGYNDMTISMTAPGSSAGGLVIAHIDSVGNVRGWRQHDTSALPDSVVRMPPDTASLRRLLHARSRTTSMSRAPLTAAEQVRVREMAAWLLRRCPA